VNLHLKFSGGPDGGITGDMFIAAVLDAFPRFEQRVMSAIDTLDAEYPVVCSLVASDTEVAGHRFNGHRFNIEPFDKYFGHIPLVFPEERSSWRSVRERLVGADIAPGVRRHAMKIFEFMVRAEAGAHGIQPERVAFEPGAWNSMAQVVGAATLIDALEAAHWSVSITNGGAMSLVAAAIVDYLCPASSRGRPLPQARSLARSGTGFGLFRSANNYVRLLCFESGDAAHRQHDVTPKSMPAAGPVQQPRQ
jgi:hypothetical protein